MKTARLCLLASTLMLFLLGLPQTDAQTQNIDMHSGSVTLTGSLANFYDSGGESGNYGNNLNDTLTIYPKNLGEKLSVTFHNFQTEAGASGDILYVYNGNSTSAPEIARLNGVNYGTLASSAANGSLTFRFISNAATTFYGWFATISVNNTPEDITMLGNATWVISSGRFVDNGGPNANYRDNCDATVTLFPTEPTGKLSVTFHEFQTQTGVSPDILLVYNGNSTSAPEIARLSGVNYGTVSSTAGDGSLTFRFVSNATTNNLGWNASVSMNNTPEDISMLASGMYTVSSGRFYDNGGPQGNYGDSKNETVTLLPQNQFDKVSVTFHECDISAGDTLYVFNGTSTTASRLASISGINYGTVTSTSSDGALTFRFVSNSSGNSAGWNGSIATNVSPEDITMIANGTFTVPCTGRFYDNGGPQNVYGHNQDVVTTIKPQDSSSRLSVTFHSFNTQAGIDVLSAFNGSDIGAPPLGSFSGALNLFTVTSTASDGSLTFRFASNASTNNFGWYASISCSPSISSYPMPSAHTVIVISADSSAFFYDSGGPNGTYSNNENRTITFSPSDSSDKISVSFSQFQLTGITDYLEVYNGTSVIAADLLATLNSDAGYGTITATNEAGSLTFRFISDNSGANSAGWVAIISTNATPKNIAQPGTYTLPSGITGFFYDAGGPGATYTFNQNLNNPNAITTIRPANSSEKISVSFSHFQTTGITDYLQVYDGNIADPSLLLATLNNEAGYGTITATNSEGSLTFRFVSDNSGANSAGWAAMISTNISQKNITQPGRYTLPSGATGFFYDAGGPGATYTFNQNLNNPNAITTIKPANSADRISVSFSHFQTTGITDYLQVYDGSNADPTKLLATLSNEAGYGTITATNSEGSLTFRFVSDNSGANSAGWAAMISTNTTPKNIAQPGTYILPSGSTGFFYDAGGPGATYTFNQNLNNPNAITTIRPAVANHRIRVTFNYFRTTGTTDFLRVYRSAGDSVTLNGLTNPDTITSTAADGSLAFRFVSDNSGTNSDGWAAMITADIISSIREDNSKTELPNVYELAQNYPNPFNPSTNIKFQIAPAAGGPNSNHVTLKVYDILGKEVATLVNEQLAPGSYETTFEAKGLASGVYFYRLQAGGYVQTKKLILQK
jgi:hypothetical protein